MHIAECDLRALGLSAVQSISAAFEHACVTVWEHVGGHQLHAYYAS